MAHLLNEVTRYRARLLLQFWISTRGKTSTNPPPGHVPGPGNKAGYDQRLWKPKAGYETLIFLRVTFRGGGGGWLAKISTLYSHESGICPFFWKIVKIEIINPKDLGWKSTNPKKTKRKKKKHTPSGWWFQPIWKNYLNWIISLGIGVKIPKMFQTTTQLWFCCLTWV